VNQYEIDVTSDDLNPTITTTSVVKQRTIHTARAVRSEQSKMESRCVEACDFKTLSASVDPEVR